MLSPRPAPVSLLRRLRLGLSAAVLGLGLTTLPAQVPADEADATIADILETAGDLSVPAIRQRTVERLRTLETRRRADTERLARERGLPLRAALPGGGIRELVDFVGDRPLYLATHNTNAAISTGADLLRAAPYALDGDGLAVGVWDGGAVRATHQEFGVPSRVLVRDGATAIDHATHVAGTIGAAGIIASARGMANAVPLSGQEGDVSGIFAWSWSVKSLLTI